MAKFGTLINAAKQVRDGTVELAQLDALLQASVAQIDTNKDGIQAINDSKGAANGIATLGSDGKLLSSQVPAIAVSEYLGDAANEAALLAFRGQKGDWATRTDLNQSYMIIANNGSQITDWREISTPSDGVTSLRNASGSVSGLNGVVTLADVAFSGAANDVVFGHADYTATNTAAALVEVMAKAKTNQSSIVTINESLGDKVEASQFKNGVASTDTIDGSNKDFTVPQAFIPGSLKVYFAGQRVFEGSDKDYTVSGQVVTFKASPDYETERPYFDYMVAA